MHHILMMMGRLLLEYYSVMRLVSLLIERLLRLIHHLSLRLRWDVIAWLLLLSVYMVHALHHDLFFLAILSLNDTVFHFMQLVPLDIKPVKLT